MAASVEIVEVSARDGIQNEKTVLASETKAELIRRAVAAGVRRLEATSFVNPKRVPQMADADALMGLIKGSDFAREVRFIGLVLNRRGYERAVAAGVHEANFVVVASETFNQRNQGVPIAETLRQLGEVAEQAGRDRVPFGVTIGASFGCPFEGEVAVEQVVRLARAAADLGAREIALADTIGVAAPSDVEERLAAVRTVLPAMALRCHFHNTRNTGLANAVAAVRMGVASLDASLGGVGGCPFAPAATGNIPTEDLVYMLNRMGVATGIDLAKAIEAAAWLGTALGVPLPAMLGRAGPFPATRAA